MDEAGESQVTREDVRLAGAAMAADDYFLWAEEGMADRRIVA